MAGGTPISRTKRIGTGACFIFMPLAFVFAFAVHPDLLRPRFLEPAELIARAHHAQLLQWGHVVVTFAAALLVVIAVHFMALLEHTTGAWSGLIGAAFAVLGAILLAADKGALCLTMTALDTLPEEQFAAMTPGLLAMFSLKGDMALLRGIALLPIGFAIQALALLATGAFPRWPAVLFLIGAVLVGVPDGVELVNLVASCMMAVALVPYGVRTITNELWHSGRVA